MKQGRLHTTSAKKWNSSKLPADFDTSYQVDVQLNKLLKEIKFSMLESHQKSGSKQELNSTNTSCQTESHLVYSLVDNQLKSLHIQIAMAKQQQGRLKLRCQSLNEQVIRTDEKLKGAIKEKNSMLITINQLEMGMLRSEDELNKAKSEIRRLKNQNLDLMDEAKLIPRLKEEIQTKKKIIFAVKGKTEERAVQSNRVVTDAYATQTQSNQQMHSKFQSTEVQCNLFQLSEKEFGEQIANITSRLTEKEFQVSDLRTQLKQQIRLFTEAQEQIHKLQSQNNSLRMSIAEMRADQELMQESLSNNLDRFIQNKLKKGDREKKLVEKQLAELQSRMQCLFNENVDLKQRNMDLQETVEKQQQLGQKIEFEIKSLYQEELKNTKYKHSLAISEYEATIHRLTHGDPAKLDRDKPVALQNKTNLAVPNKQSKGKENMLR